MRYVAFLQCSLLLIAVSIGCARYEYDVTSPPQVAGHVGTKADYIFALDPLEYRLRTVDNRLVMRIYNSAEQSVALVGERSWVVDPQGQSHPLATKTVAPDSFIKLIFPPPQPRLYRTGPSIGIGVGGRIGRGVSDDPSAVQPYYLAAYDVDAAEMGYWEWRGTGEIRLHLVYVPGDPESPAVKTFAHDLAIRRVRVK